MTALTRPFTLLASFLILALGPALPLALGGDPPETGARLWADEPTQPWLSPDASPRPHVCLNFQNQGDASIYLPTTAPFHVTDAMGHTTYRPSALQTYVQVAPGSVYRLCFNLSSSESLEDAGQHTDPRWLPLSAATLAPPDHYNLEWLYVDGDDNLHRLHLPLHITEA